MSTCLPGKTSHRDPGVGAEDHLPHAHHLHRARLQPADLDRNINICYDEPEQVIKLILKTFKMQIREKSNICFQVSLGFFKY